MLIYWFIKYNCLHMCLRPCVDWTCAAGNIEKVMLYYEGQKSKQNCGNLIMSSIHFIPSWYCEFFSMHDNL